MPKVGRPRKQPVFTRNGVRFFRCTLGDHNVSETKMTARDKRPGSWCKPCTAAYMRDYNREQRAAAAKAK